MTIEVKNSKIGRPKGSPNARTQDLFDLTEKLDVNPFEILLMFAKRDYGGLGLSEFTEKTTKTGDKISEPTISPETQMNAAGKACEYLFPKRKAIEHSGEDVANALSSILSAISANK